MVPAAGSVWGALYEPHCGHGDRRDRPDRALCSSEGNRCLSGRARSFEIRLGLIPPLLSSDSVVLRKLYPLPAISPGLSFLGCEMDVWVRCLASPGAQFCSSTAPSPESPAQNCPREGQGEVTRLGSRGVAPRRDTYSGLRLSPGWSLGSAACAALTQPHHFMDEA